MAPQTAEQIIADISAPPPVGTPHALPIPGSERPNRTAVYRHWRFRDQPLLTKLEPEVESVHDLLELAIKKYGSRKALGVRKWNPATQEHENKFEFMTYAEMGERRKNLGAGIIDVVQQAGYTNSKYGVGIWSPNTPEWHLTDMACTSQSLFSVSLYETLGPDTTEYIINHAELPVVACSANHIPVLIKLASRVPTLKIIVSLDALDKGEHKDKNPGNILKNIAAESGLKLYEIQELEEIGLKSGRGFRPPTWNDLTTINYTSGTTGPPKGVVMHQGNAVAAINGARSMGNVQANDIHISYLPLAHIYGRMIDQLALVSGAAVGFFRGDVLGLVDDLKLLKPTSFPSVPRLFNRFNSAIKAATVDAPGFKGALSRHVIDVKKGYMRQPPGSTTNTHFFYDRLWTKKVRAAVGLDNARSMISGSAQLDPDVQEFLGAAFGNEFRQGYGMTETYAGATVQLSRDYSAGNLGPPLPCLELCLESVPDYNYSVDDKPNPRGEVLMRGPTLFQGYHKNDEENQKVLEADGWFHSGDIGEIDSLGRLRIIDRKKNVLKLAQGEYISPERIENVYLGNTNIVATAYVHGDSKESTLVAIFGVDPENFPPFASKVLGRTVAAGDVAGINAAAREPKVKEAVLKVLDKIGRGHKFNNWERVRNVHLLLDPFTPDNGLLTPTLKLKRPQAAKAFREDIDRLYAEIKATEEPSKFKL
ncbi:hypothetical protein MY8738_006943 [Beauveria namnaoensis]